MESTAKTAVAISWRLRFVVDVFVFRVGQIGLTDSRSKMAVLDSAKHFQLDSIREEIQRAARHRNENVTVISDTSGRCSLVFLSRSILNQIDYANVLCWILQFLSEYVNSYSWYVFNM